MSPWEKNEGRICPNHFHRPFPIGQNAPPVGANSLSLYPLGEWEARIQALGRNVVSKSKKKGNPVRVKSWARDIGGSWRGLKRCTRFMSQHSEDLRHQDISQRASFQDKEGVFPRSLKSHHLENCLKKLKDRLLDFQGQEEKQRQGEGNKKRVLTNSLCPFKIRKVKYELLPSPM